MNPTGVITNYEEAMQIVAQIRERRIPGVVGMAPHRQEYYRGQLSDDWHLRTSLVRNITDPNLLKQKEKEILEAFQLKMKETGQLSKLYLHGNPQGFQNDWAIMCQAQHYGIPTRLLDWTIKPEVALYFAVDNAALDAFPGQFWVSYLPDEFILVDGGPDRQYYHINPADIDKTIMINPSFYWDDNWSNLTAEVRRARQHGKFTLQPFELAVKGLDEQDKFTQDYNSDPGLIIEKYVIPAQHKAQLRLDLLSKGFTGEYLYAKDDAEINQVRDFCRGLLIS